MTTPKTDARSGPLHVSVVPHTHWDREWYHVAPRFRQRLLALVDALLAAPASGPFLLDGQAITLRDVVTAAPDRRRALEAALAAGQLEAGPWFVLADNLIPSGEAIVRNLAAGHRVMRQFTAVAPPVAWCPDSFGHPAAMPMIARGFGLELAVVWRGMGGATHPHVDAFSWRAPDGTALLTHHLPPDGYEFGSALPTEPEAATRRWQRLSALFAERNRSGVVLLPNGADHHARQPDLQQAMDALQHAAGTTAHLVQESLGTWARHLIEACRTITVPHVSGELRDSYGYTWTLGGTVGTRGHQKRRNAWLERGLLRDVEPWLALVCLHATSSAHHAVHPAAQLTMAQLPALLECAWEDLLATHPHDTLCGCSVDAVARNMDVQQELVAEQGKGLREAALALALGHDPVTARGVTTFDAPRLVLRNRAARDRSGLAWLTVHDTLGDAPVGPGSGHVPMPSVPVLSPPRVLEQWPSQWMGARTGFLRRESPQHYPDNDLVQSHRLLAWVPSVPAFGIAVHDTHGQPAGSDAPMTSPPPVSCTREGDVLQLDNGRLRLTVARRRTSAGAAPLVSLHVNDRTLTGLLDIETQHDAGDSYTPSLRGHVESLRCTRARLVTKGPLRATVRLWWRTASPQRGVGPRGALRVITDLHVDAMSPVVQCDLRGHSRRSDHRTRLVWHTDVQQPNVWADAAFGPVRRTPIIAPEHSAEAVPQTMPMHRWLMAVNAMFGATMIADGHAEAAVEHTPDGSRLALTVLRGIGELSRHDLPERPGHAGWPAATPDAQCLGQFAARTALFLHGPLSDDTLARVRDVCDDVLLPLVGESWRDLARAPGTLRGPQLHGEAFEASAVTVAERHAQAVVLRAVNLTTREARGSWLLPHDGPWLVTPCRLDETPLGHAQSCGAHVPLVAGPREVVTLLVQRVRE